MLARVILSLAMLSLAAPPVVAQAQKPPAKPAGPKQIGKFGDWTAATYQEGGSTVCYAFVRAKTSVPAVAGRGQVVLSVTQRASGRDAVAIDAGFSFAANATVGVQVDQSGLDSFYTAQRNAFARDGKAAVAAFQRGTLATARSPGPKDTQVTDTFSLSGFSDAYKAIGKECPPR
jgi:invasion protein IalB